MGQNEGQPLLACQGKQTRYKDVLFESSFPLLQVHKRRKKKKKKIFFGKKKKNKTKKKTAVRILFRDPSVVRRMFGADTRTYFLNLLFHYCRSTSGGKKKKKKKKPGCTYSFSGSISSKSQTSLGGGSIFVACFLKETFLIVSKAVLYFLTPDVASIFLKILAGEEV